MVQRQLQVTSIFMTDSFLAPPPRLRPQIGQRISWSVIILFSKRESCFFGLHMPKEKEYQGHYGKPALELSLFTRCFHCKILFFNIYLLEASFVQQMLFPICNLENQRTIRLNNLFRWWCEPVLLSNQNLDLSRKL